MRQQTHEYDAGLCTDTLLCRLLEHKTVKRDALEHKLNTLLVHGAAALADRTTPAAMREPQTAAIGLLLLQVGEHMLNTLLVHGAAGARRPHDAGCDARASDGCDEAAAAAGG
jgi:hypothetical protein